MNICYLIDVSPEKFKGGGQMHLLNLIQQMNFQFSIFNFQLFAGPESNTVIRLAWMFYVIPQVIFHHFFKQKFDLIHAHSVPAMMAGKILSSILRIPIVVTIHGSTLNISNKDTPSSTERSILYGFLEKRILTGVKYDAQITVSRDFLQFPNVNKNVIYIPNGVDIVKFTKLHDRLQSFVNFGTPRILFVGRKNDPVKGFQILLKAMESVKKEIPGAKLLAADGSMSQDQVIDFYYQADLFVLPSLSEGFPLTLLEAWAAKLPVVATRVGELPYLIKDGINGSLVDPGSTEKLALAIVKALKNRNLAKLGKNGYNLCKEYTWEKTARKTLKVYQKIYSRF